MASVNFMKLRTAKQVRSIMWHCDKETRQKYSHENKHINPALSETNVQSKGDLNQTYRRYRDRITEIDNAVDGDGKKINTNNRKDRVTAFALETSVPDGLSDEQQSQWCKDYIRHLGQKYGSKNLIAVYVHKDEVHAYLDQSGNVQMSRWHVHAIVVPEINGKLNGKQFSARAEMRALNQEIDAMTKERYGVKYMTGEKPHKRSVEQLKSLSEAAIRAREIKSNQLDMDIDQKNKQMASLDKGIGTLQNKQIAIENDIKLLQDQYVNLVDQIKQIETENADVLGIFSRSQLNDQNRERGINFGGDGEYGDF